MQRRDKKILKPKWCNHNLVMHTVTNLLSNTVIPGGLYTALSNFKPPLFLLVFHQTTPPTMISTITIIIPTTMATGTQMVTTSSELNEEFFDCCSVQVGTATVTNTVVVCVVVTTDISDGDGMKSASQDGRLGADVVSDCIV